MYTLSTIYYKFLALYQSCLHSGIHYNTLQELALQLSLQRMHCNTCTATHAATNIVLWSCGDVPKSHVAHMNEACHIYELGMSHI